MNAGYKQASAILVVAGILAFGLANCGGGGGGQAPATISGNTMTKNVVLTGVQENPSINTVAVGSGDFTVDLDSGLVTGFVTTNNLTGVVAHIHEGASGINGPILIPLAQGPAGTWTVPANSTLTSSQIDSFKAGNLYVNVHSAANPGGETRAQIGRQIFFSTMTGAQEVPPVTTAAIGTARVIYDPATGKISGSVTTTGIVGTIAHIHTGVIGVAGPITIPFTGGPTNWVIPETALTLDQQAALLQGNFYSNVHSAANPGGEIRGQVYTPSTIATMAGSNETPPNTSTGTGTCWYTINPFTKEVTGLITTSLTNAVAAHSHTGAPGVAGPVVVPMSSTTPGTWVTAPGAVVTDSYLAAYMKREIYCNVHTAAFPGGEIRGQQLPQL